MKINSKLHFIGVYLADDAAKLVKFAIQEQNYLMIDTAEFYENEIEVGEGILNSNKERDSIFVTSKLWSTSGGRIGCIKRLNECLNNLKSNYVDQYLLHAPQGGKVLECYDAMLDLQKEG